MTVASTPSAGAGPRAARDHAPCTVCGADAPLPLRGLRDHLTGERFHAVRCGACEAVYLVDPPPPAEIGRYYETPAGAAMQTAPSGLFAQLRDRRIGSDLRPLLERAPQPATVVDLGTGDGSVAAHLARRGHTALGLDVYPAGRWARTDVAYRQIAFDALTPEVLAAVGPPDAAVMRHVLEHVHRPVEVLKTLRAAGTRHVLIVVPNVDSRLARPFGEHWYYWDPPRHLTSFSAASLRRTAEEAGFTVPFLRTYGLDELATSAHRALGLRPRGQRLSHALRPTGLLAGGSSVLASLYGDTVLHAVLEAR